MLMQAKKEDDKRPVVLRVETPEHLEDLVALRELVATGASWTVIDELKMVPHRGLSRFLRLVRSEPPERLRKPKPEHYCDPDVTGSIYIQATAALRAAKALGLSEAMPDVHACLAVVRWAEAMGVLDSASEVLITLRSVALGEINGFICECGTAAECREPGDGPPASICGTCRTRPEQLELAYIERKHDHLHKMTLPIHHPEDIEDYISLRELLRLGLRLGLAEVLAPTHARSTLQGFYSSVTSREQRRSGPLPHSAEGFLTTSLGWLSATAFVLYYLAETKVTNHGTPDAYLRLHIKPRALLRAYKAYARTHSSKRGFLDVSRAHLVLRELAGGILNLGVCGSGHAQLLAQEYKPCPCCEMIRKGVPRAVVREARSVGWDLRK